MDISCLTEWNSEFEVELPVLPFQRKQFGVDNELVELLWQNGEVVLQSQTDRKSSNDSSKSKQVHKHEDTKSRFVMTSTNSIQDEEAAISWMHCPIDESFEKELYSDFLSEIPSSNPVFDGENFLKFPSSQQNEFGPISSPPPSVETLDSTHQDQVLTDGRKGSNLDMSVVRQECIHMGLGDVHELSVTTMGSSHCGSNQVASSCGTGNRSLSAKVNFADRVKKVSPISDECTEIETLGQALTSSSGGSGSSFWKTNNQSNETYCHKRKSMDAELSDCLSDATELESGSGNKSSKKSGSNTRRSRVAEVHNLSERRRRDKINEKMRALQELIPHSQKSDKASMLDEVIDYMKSLQSQIQFMWMGSQMPQMVLPGIQNCMSRAGMGISPATTIPQIHNLMRFSRLPQIYQAMAVAPTAVGMRPVLNHVSYQNQMQIPRFQEQYANYSSLYLMQNTSQRMNIFGLASHSSQLNHDLEPPRNGSGSVS